MSIQELKQILALLERISKPKRIDQLREEIKKNPDLKYLFEENGDGIENYRTGHGYSVFYKDLNHLQKCVLRTLYFPILEEYIELYVEEHPEEVHYQNRNGLTALHLAVCNINSSSSIKSVQILLDHGADIQVTDINNFSVLKYVLLTNAYNPARKMILEKLEDHSIEIEGKKIIQLLTERKAEPDLFKLAVERGANKDDMFDSDLLEIYKFL